MQALPSASIVLVDYATTDDTANGTDFTARSGLAVFTPGEMVQTVAVPIVDDTIEEAAERFSLQLSNPVGATLPDRVGQATIGASDHLPVALPVITASPLMVEEGTGFAEFVVRLNAPSTVLVGATFEMTSGSASTSDFHHHGALPESWTPYIQAAAGSGALFFTGDLDPQFSSARLDPVRNALEVLTTQAGGLRDDLFDTLDRTAAIDLLASVTSGRVGLFVGSPATDGAFHGRLVTTQAGGNTTLRFDSILDQGQMLGTAGDDIIAGSLDADWVDGGAGNDTLLAGGDGDIALGGADADTFVVDGSSADLGNDTFLDLARGSDKIEFSGFGTPLDAFDDLDSNLDGVLDGADDYIAVAGTQTVIDLSGLTGGAVAGELTIVGVTALEPNDLLFT